MIVIRQSAFHKLAFLGGLLALSVVALSLLARHAGAETILLPSGEPNPNCPELRLWLRADSGIKDAEGRGPEAPAFSGMVAAWNDRSPQKFDLGAPPEKAPLFVPRQPAAGNQPTVAFNGEQVLTRTNSLLHDRAASTVILVVQGQPKPDSHPSIYAVGKGQDRRERLSLVFSNGVVPSLSGLSGRYIENRGEQAYQIELGLPSDGRAGGRFAAIISSGDIDRRSTEFYDALSGPTGGTCAAGLLDPQAKKQAIKQATTQATKQATKQRKPGAPPPPPRESASYRCSRDFSLGGYSDFEESLFCGQIAEMIVFNRALSSAERRDMLKYLRRRYDFDMTDGLLPAGTFLLPAEDFDGNWDFVSARLPMQAGRYLRNRHVTAEDEFADEGIKTTVQIPNKGTYHVWVRAFENHAGASGPAGSALKTTVQGKELQVTHVRGAGDIVWRKAGEVELEAGPAEIVVRGEGPGGKDCDTVLISPTAFTPDAVEEICALAQRLRRVGGESHLTAVFENGLRLDGSLLTGWRWTGPSGQVPRPDPAAIPALVCLQLDRRRVETERQPSDASEAMLEFQNGDRMLGTICGYVPASTKEKQAMPSQLILRPPVGFFQNPKQTISVETDWLRRIIFEQSVRDRSCPPKTLICRDGRRYTFRAVRWGAESVSVLTEESLERIPLGEIADLRLSPADAWNTYYRELSILDPEGKGGIVRVETTEGIAITASTSGSSSTIRSSQRPREHDGNKSQRQREAGTPQRLMQPVWSREPIPVSWNDMRLLWQAPAHMVPLSRFSPEQATQRGVLGGSWKWQADRNVAGGILRSDGLDYLWGFGVHAPNEMVFLLPDCVRAFRASVGIDAVVGNAGCAIAKVYVNQASGAPLYQSKPLVGSAMPVSTGEIALPPAAGAARRLVLVTENGAEPRSAGGDPLGIGDHVDWLEPILLLDPAKLHAEVAKQGKK